MDVDQSIAACVHAKQRRQETNQRQQKIIVVVKWANLNRWPNVHQVAVLFSLADNTNHGPVWPEPLLSNSACL